MNVETDIACLFSADDLLFLKMKDALDSCVSAGVDAPTEVLDYFKTIYPSCKVETMVAAFMKGCSHS